LVAAWARPYRHPKYSGFHDDMYLAMENGDIYYMEVEETQSNNALVQATSKASFLKCSIGTAFAVLDNGLGNDDRIVAGGEMSSGGIYLLNISAYAVDAGAKQEESVTNWAPVLDFELVNLSARGQGNEGIAERDRVYACTGRGDHGAITELRYGIQATARRPEPVDGLQGVRQLFILPDTSGGGYFVLSSLADQSFLCYRSSGRDGEWLSCEGIDLLELDETTLAAGSMELPSRNDLSTLWSVQITQNAITILQLSKDNIKPEVGMEASEIPHNRRLQRRCDGGDTIISAAIHGRFVLLTLRNGSDVNVVLASIEVKQDSDEFLVPIGTPVALTDDPTFIGIIELRDRVMVVVGTRRATLLIFQCDDSQGLRFIKEQTMSDHATESQHDLNFCESAVMLYTDSAAKLLCGLRGGTVVVFNLIAPELDLKLVRSQDIRFGPIPVQLYLDVHRKDLAFALAGPEVYRFDMPCDIFRAAQLVFVVQDKDIDPTIQSIVQVNSPIDGNNTLVCVTNDQIFCADVGENCKICARRLKLYETPRRLLFYEPLGMFIVACVKTVGRDSTGLDGDRKSFCSLKIIDPKT
ncbi:mono-functional DNA-alkylating methyl methanesulfonate N-term-domain-containing protein, partial [Trichophaea hybrida]